MCTLSLVSAMATGVGKGLEYQAQAKAASFNSQILENNAALARNQAVEARNIAGLDRQRAIFAFQGVKAKGRTNYAAGNVKLGSGAPALFEEDLDTKQAADLALLDQNTLAQEGAFLSKSNVLLTQADFLQKQAKSYQAAGALSVGSTLLSASEEVDFPKRRKR